MASINNSNVIKQDIPHVLRLGLECNVKCLFCNVPYEDRTKDSLSTMEAKRQISLIIKGNPNVSIDISGGEPTIRKDLADLIMFAYGKGVSVVRLQTNGIAFAHDDYVRALGSSGLKKIFVGLHASIPRIHDYLVGFKGAFKYCINGIGNALSHGMEVNLNPVITTESYKDFPRYVKFVKNNFPEIKFISLSVIQPHGRAWVNNYLVPDYRIISPFIREGLSLGAKYGILIINPYCGLPLCIGGWRNYLEHCDEYKQNSSTGQSRHSYKNANTDKIKCPQCTFCRLTKACNGVWKEYVLLHGFSGLREIK